MLSIINVTLNYNEPSDGIVTLVNVSHDGIRLYKYRNTTYEDDGTLIVCTAGQDRGVIELTVFRKELNNNKYSYNILLKGSPTP